MKNLVPILILSFVTAFVNAQNVKTSQSEIIKKTTFVDFGLVGDEVYAITQEKNKMSLLIFDKNLRRRQQSIFQEKQGEKKGLISTEGFHYRQTLFLKDKVLVLFDSYDKTKKQTLLLCQQLDLSGKYVDNLTTLDKMDSKIDNSQPKSHYVGVNIGFLSFGGMVTSQNKSGSFNVVVSEDSSKFLVVQTAPYDKKADEKIVLTTFDNNLKQLASTDLQMPYKGKDVNIKDVKLSNSGDAFVLCSVAKEKKDQKKGEDDSFFSVFSVMLSANNTVAEYNLEMQNKKITDVAFEIQDKKLLATGFYSNIETTAKRTKDIDGFFYLAFDILSHKTLTSSIKEIPTTVINQLLGKAEDKKVKEGKGISNQFDIKKIYKRADGSLVIATELAWYEVTVNRTPNGGTYTTTTYFARNIFLIDVDVKGEIKSFVDIPKRQSGLETNRYISYTGMQQGDNLLFAFADNARNSQKEVGNVKDASNMNNVLKSEIALVLYTSDGKVERKNMAKDKLIRALFFRQGQKIGDGSYIIPFDGKGGFGFMKVDMQ